MLVTGYKEKENNHKVQVISPIVLQLQLDIKVTTEDSDGLGFVLVVNYFLVTTNNDGILKYPAFPRTESISQDIQNSQNHSKNY